MKIEVVLPKIGMAMQDAFMGHWYKQVGEYVEKREPLVEIETEKVVETIESPESGYLIQINYSSGDLVEIDQVIAVLDTENPAEEKSDSPAMVNSVTPPVSESPIPLPTQKQTVTELSRMRQTIASRMVQSLKDTAQLTLMREADFTEVKRVRDEKLKQVGISFTDILVKLTGMAIENHPVFNSRLDGHSLISNPEVNIGLAVATEAGLVVPVIRNVDQLTLKQIAAERTRLVDLVTNARYHTEDLTGSSFTITNLGNYDIEFFTPIINPPELAILGVGKIVEKAMVLEGEIKIRSMIGLSLTVDHRVIDGAPGSLFLKDLVDSFQNFSVDSIEKS